MSQVLAIIGGSGLYSLPELKNIQTHNVTTPFGDPSSAVIEGQIGDVKLLFIARHGEGHVLLPSEVNYRANIFALKQLGATHLLSISAVGSLKEEIEPGDLVIPAQYIDKTNGRKSTFFGNGIVGHVMFAHPTCPELRQLLYQRATSMQYKVHQDSTLVVMEGPAFSTRAESNLHRSWNADIIGMTAMPEAKLAREAELCYATLALSTDYDCWRDDEEEVSVDVVLETFRSNVEKARKMILATAQSLNELQRKCRCPKALDGAVMTQPSHIAASVTEKMAPIFGRVL
ncbi:MAG: S-methyl-5'-thioadenosine phosphorylase [Deltaproteobacteria bacterium]|nr:S-methyl-5'-thioadenosine phosphorylase [Deltaproteobacteria bacterium]